MSSFKPIRTLVAENEAIAPMLGQLAHLAKLQKTYADTVPASLLASSRVAAMEGSTMIVAATNGAAAAQLKQMLPRLFARFLENQKRDQEVTAIRVIVQPAVVPGAGASNKPVVPGTPMSDASLGALAAALPESPLKETVARMQKRRRGTTGRQT
jgi:hypothetical protein